MQKLMKNSILNLLTEMRAGQEKTLLQLGRRIIPTLSPEDILQPNDYEVLENNPHFRYEEGILHGIQSVEAALRCEFNDQLPFLD